MMDSLSNPSISDVRFREESIHELENMEDDIPNITSKNNSTVNTQNRRYVHYEDGNRDCGGGSGRDMIHGHTFSTHEPEVSEARDQDMTSPRQKNSRDSSEFDAPHPRHNNTRFKWNSTNDLQNQTTSHPSNIASLTSYWSTVQIICSVVEMFICGIFHVMSKTMAEVQ